jgi:Zn-dependent peptidase ImmA (M78 family)
MNKQYERFKEIGELAETISNEYFPQIFVDPLKIIHELGLTYSFGHYRDAFDGLLECKDGKFHIYCNLDRVESPNSPRARFTLAHELGHYFIDEHRNALLNGMVPAHSSFCDFESENVIEREADHFAANLILPKNKFIKAAKKEEIGLQGILSISRKFGASITSTTIRYIDEALGKAVVIKWNHNDFQWKRISNELFNSGLKKTIESPEKVIRNSPTWKTMNGEAPFPAEFFSGGSTVSAWFPFINEKWKQNELLIEEAITLGRFGMLTFLHVDGETIKAYS